MVMEKTWLNDEMLFDRVFLLSIEIIYFVEIGSHEVVMFSIASQDCFLIPYGWYGDLFQFSLVVLVKDIHNSL